MPIKGARYRVKTTKSGKKVRLAFRDDEVVEAKNMKSGETHTPEEFAEDKKRKKKKSKRGALASMLSKHF
jgi:hypothetical protein